MHLGTVRVDELHELLLGSHWQGARVVFPVAFSFVVMLLLCFTAPSFTARDTGMVTLVRFTDSLEAVLGAILLNAVRVVQHVCGANVNAMKHALAIRHELPRACSRGCIVQVIVGEPK